MKRKRKETDIQCININTANYSVSWEVWTSWDLFIPYGTLTCLSSSQLSPEMNENKILQLWIYQQLQVLLSNMCKWSKKDHRSKKEDLGAGQMDREPSSFGAPKKENHLKLSSFWIDSGLGPDFSLLFHLSTHLFAWLRGKKKMTQEEVSAYK